MTTERISDHVKFAYWVPNVSGGLVTSDIEQRTDWHYDYNKKLAQTAENTGFEYALSPGALRGELRRRVSARVDQLQPGAAAGDAAVEGDRRRSPGLWQPAVLAKLGPPPTTCPTVASRSTWCPAGSRTSSPTWVSPGSSTTSATAAARSSCRSCGKLWTQDDVDFRGDFYRIHDFTLKPKPSTPPLDRIRRSSRAATRPPRGATAALRRLGLPERQGLRGGDRPAGRGARPRS